MQSSRVALMEISDNESTPRAEESRRKSGRAVRAPEKYEPDVAASQVNGTAKRKRSDAGDDEEEGVETDASEEEDESDEEIESADEEELREARKRAKKAKKPVAKKPKTNGSVAHTRAPAVKQLPSRPKKSKKIALADDEAEGLYAEIFTSGDDSEIVVANWLQRYADDPSAALTDMINCVLKSAGCNLKVSQDDINDPDNAPTKLNEIQDEHKDHEGVDYPLISRLKTYGGFRSCLTGFFMALISNMHASGDLYTDLALMENIQVWVSTMTSSGLRPFRHTATVISLSIVNELCDITKTLEDTTAKVRRQLDSEKKSKRANKGRVSSFEESVAEGEKKADLCKGYIKDFFDTVFIHRYRDVEPKIRTECTQALGYWIIALPDVFFEGEYLRYLGWILSDPSAPTRQEAVKQLEKLLRNQDNVAGLRHFIERFRPRIVEIAAQDSETSVRTSAIELLDKIREAGMLEPDDIDVVGKLIFDHDARVRKAVVGFFAENVNDLYESKLEDLGGEEALESLSPDDEDYDRPNISWIKLKCLSSVLATYDVEDREVIPSQAGRIGASRRDIQNSVASDSRFTLAAQALIGKIPELKDWEVLAGFLLYDNSKPISKQDAARNTETALLRECQLEEKEEMILLEVLNATVKSSLAQADEVERGRKKSTSHMEALEIQESMARSLAATIPRLLKKYGSQPNAATIVLRLEHVLNLNVFQELRQDSTYAKLLDDISRQFTSHDDHDVLDEASAALLHARSYEELEDIAEDKVQSLWADSLRTLQALAKDKSLTARGGLQVDHLTSLSRTVRRIAKLSSITDCVELLETTPSKSSKNKAQSLIPIDVLLDIVDRGILEEIEPAIDDIEDDMVASAIRAVMFYFMWKMQTLKKALTNSTSITSHELTQVRERQRRFKSSLVGAISSRGTLDDLRLVASGFYLDLHALFSTLAAPSQTERPTSSDVASLVMIVGPDVQAELLSIFNIAEKNLAKKLRKSLEAPADDDDPEEIEVEPEDDEDEDLSESDRKAEALQAEQRLCEFTAKLVVALIAGVIDVIGPNKGKLAARLQRNRNRLGPNFKEVVAYLDGPKVKAPKRKASKAPAPDKFSKSKEIVVDDDDNEEEDPFAEEPEEGTVEDLRRRELLDEEDAPESIEEDEEANGDGDDDEVMGD